MDATGRVVWRATFARKISGLAVHEFGFEVLAGSLIGFPRTPGERRDGQATGEPQEGGCREFEITPVWCTPNATLPLTRIDAPTENERKLAEETTAGGGCT